MRKLLLRADIPSLGRIGDLVDVSEGDARNCLIPQGLALEPTAANRKKIEEEKKVIEAKRAEELKEKKDLAERLEGFELTIVAEANEQGRLFGSVGPKEITDALSNEGYNIDPDQIELEEHIKQVDKYTVPVHFGEDISCNVVVWVAPEKSTSDAAEGAASDDGSE